jgi:hypothetical protein
MGYITIGIIIYFLTYLDLINESTNRFSMLEWLHWLEVNRADYPIVYWIIIFVQIVVGTLLVSKGVNSLG